jgi:hypothetical protein
MEEFCNPIRIKFIFRTAGHFSQNNRKYNLHFSLIHKAIFFASFLLAKAVI